MGLSPDNIIFIIYVSKIEMPKRKFTQKNIVRIAKAFGKKNQDLLQFQYFYIDVQIGDFQSVKKALKRNIDLTQQLKNGATILHAAAQGRGGVKMCALLEDAGANVMINTPNKYGYTPLHTALSFEYGCNKRERDLAVWFLSKSILLPFPDTTSIVDWLTKQRDNVLVEIDEEKLGTHQYDPFNNADAEEYNEDYNETQEAGKNNGNSVIENAMENLYNSNTDEVASLQESLRNLTVVLTYAKYLKKIMTRRITFNFLQEVNFQLEPTTVYNRDWNLQADLRMTVAQLITIVKKLYGLQNISLLLKQGEVVVKMDEGKRLAYYKIPNDAKITVVVRLQSGQGRLTRRNRRS